LVAALFWRGATLRIAVLANGQLDHADQVRSLADQADLLIAADGGSRTAYELGLSLDLLIGDLDSVDPRAQEDIQQGQLEMIRHPAEKDETDLELALIEAAQRGDSEIVVLTALGGRTDQMLANIYLLALPVLQGKKVCIVEGVETIWLIRGRSVLRGNVGDLISLIPFGGAAHGIRTTGLQYALHDGSLWLARARGISNVLTQRQATVEVDEGWLLAVHRGQAPLLRWPFEMNQRLIHDSSSGR
jgi:thiamine pyrophosphokinase